jgi:23S rRNA pseudouridine2605 synthase
MMERLQKIIANRGYCSRRKAEQLILEVKVKINGIIINELGYKANSDDEIEVEGIKLEVSPKEYYLLYKPRGLLVLLMTIVEEKQ